ncbi:MAG: hypothetical protein WC437_04650 [Patescibacteria group bacterium]
MKFNYSADRTSSLYHYTLFLLGLDYSDTTSFPVEDFARSVNAWLRTLGFTMWQRSYGWQFDDSNQTTLPIATATLTNGQGDYSLPSTILAIEEVYVMNSAGHYVRIKQIDPSLRRDDLETTYSVAGMPECYDVIGNSVVLYPAPSSSNVTLASGLKLHLSRDIVPFESTDTTDSPGIPESLQPYLCYGSALDYAMSKNLDTNKVVIIRSGLEIYQRKVEDYAEERNKDFPTKITLKKRSSR